MKETTKVPSAFPTMHVGYDGASIEDGMTLRDWFAGLALQSILSSWSGNVTVEPIAKGAYHVADAMLAERAKP